MITAEEARELSEQNNPINKEISNFLHDIERKINAACMNGETYTRIRLNEANYFKHLEKVASELRMQGFTVNTQMDCWMNDVYAVIDIFW
jgi:hypothetical protein